MNKNHREQHCGTKHCSDPAERAGGTWVLEGCLAPAPLLREVCPPHTECGYKCHWHGKMKELACYWHCSPPPVVCSVIGEWSMVTFILILVEICNNKGSQSHDWQLTASPYCSSFKSKNVNDEQSVWSFSFSFLMSSQTLLSDVTCHWWGRLLYFNNFGCSDIVTYSQRFTCIPTWRGADTWSNGCGTSGSLHQQKTLDHSMFGSQWEQSDGEWEQPDIQLAQTNRTQVCTNLTSK